MNPIADARPAASKPSTLLFQSRSLVTWSLDPDAYCSAHEHATRNDFARRLAVLKGCAGDYDERQSYAGAPYFVPSNTVIDGQPRACGPCRDDARRQSDGNAHEGGFQESGEKGSWTGVLTIVWTKQSLCPSGSRQ
jgi:hypothetical protein